MRNDEPTDDRRYVIDRDGDVWTLGVRNRWRCMTTDSVDVAGADLVNVCGPLTELVPAARLVAVTTELARAQAEVKAFRPNLILSQNCRDGLHGNVSGERCIGCDCICHLGEAESQRLRAQLAKVNELNEEAAQRLGPAPYWIGTELINAIRAAAVLGGNQVDGPAV